MLVLAIGAFATLSPLLNRSFPELAALLPAIIRAGVWSLSILIAFALFVFASELKPAPDTIELGRGFVVAMLAKWIFWIAMLAWMYTIFRGLMT